MTRNKGNIKNKASRTEVAVSVIAATAAVALLSMDLFLSRELTGSEGRLHWLRTALLAMTAFGAILLAWYAAKRSQAKRRGRRNKS